MSIPNLHPGEVDDFKNELRRCGRSIDEFDVSATPQSLADQSGGISAYSGTSLFGIARPAQSARIEPAMPRAG
jgi:hypothetical protein